MYIFVSGHRIKAARLKADDSTPNEIKNHLAEKDLNKTMETEQLPSWQKRERTWMSFGVNCTKKVDAFFHFQVRRPQNAIYLGHVDGFSIEVESTRITGLSIYTAEKHSSYHTVEVVILSGGGGGQVWGDYIPDTVITWYKSDLNFEHIVRKGIGNEGVAM